MNTAEFLGRIASAGTRALDRFQAIIVRALRDHRMADADSDALLSALAERRAALKKADPIAMPRENRSSYRSRSKGRRQNRPKVIGPCNNEIFIASAFVGSLAGRVEGHCIDLGDGFVLGYFSQVCFVITWEG